MGRINRTMLAVLLLSLITLYGCGELVKDTQSLLLHQFKRSEIFGLVAGFGTTFAAVPDLIKCGHEPEDGGNHGRFSDSLGLLRLINCFATCSPLECGRSVG
jgi:MtN3 and saliva related transmembrane protein